MSVRQAAFAEVADEDRHHMGKRFLFRVAIQVIPDLQRILVQRIRADLALRVIEAEHSIGVPDLCRRHALQALCKRADNPKPFGRGIPGSVPHVGNSAA
jgi:hypothetical protein